MMDEVARKRRRGPAPLDAAVKRVHMVSSRLSAAELAMLDERRAAFRMRRGEYLRAAALQRDLPPTIPAINRQQWADLARLAANLNQIAKHLNGGGQPHDCADLREQIAECLDALKAVRGALIGVDQ